MIADFLHLADFRVVPSVRVTGPTRHSVLWNAMIHPLQNMTLKGVVWYQGELAIYPLVSVSFCCIAKCPKELMVSKPSEFIILFSSLFSGLAEWYSHLLLQLGSPICPWLPAKLSGVWRT